MDLRNTAIGMIRHDELLNALLAIWKTQNSIVNTHNSRFSQAYKLGFEEGLDAIAQAAGVAEAFEAGKAVHLAKIKAKLDSELEIIDGQTNFINTY